MFSRRQLLRHSSAGFGALAFSGLSHAQGAHFPAKEKRVIFLCMRGGPSQMETFDPKPELTKRTGQLGRRANVKLLGSKWKFTKHGQSGLDVVELMPEIAKHADKLCLLRGMTTDNENHPQALEQLHTGSFQFVRPSMGAWAVHGLGPGETAVER